MRSNRIVLTSLTMLFTVLTACTTGNDTNPQGLAFYLLDDGTYSVGVGYATQLSTIEVPKTYLGKPVTKVATWGFANEEMAPMVMSLQNLKAITLPDTIESISEFGFTSCPNLKSVNIGNGLKTLERNAFSWCDSLASITLPASLQTLSNWVFVECESLSNIAYEGTVAQWNTITGSSEQWAYRIPATEVHCSDGNVSISKS